MARNPTEQLEPRNARVLGGLALVLAIASGGCGKGTEETAGGADSDKKKQEAAIAELKQPIALISAYRPHLKYPDANEKFAPKRRADYEKSTLAAANEVRHAANGVKQKIEKVASPATKDLEAALRGVTAVCAEASEVDKLLLCEKAVDTLDAALQKLGAAAASAGVTAKVPRIAPESVTDEARNAIANFLKVKGPGPAETAYFAKRVDAAAGTGDVIAACQAAASEIDGITRTFEKADEPIRLVAVTHKMSIDSQCNALNAVEALRSEVGNCKKKAKSTECKITCAKVKTILDDGVPAAAFSPLEKEHAEICAEK